MKETISFEDFEKIDIRIGTIIEVTDFPKAKKPAYQLTIDFGELGIKKSSAQITDLYSKEELVNKQVSAIAVPIIFVPLMLFAGFFTNQNNIPEFLISILRGGKS